MNNKRKAGEAAPYGQACLQCFKSKCKCVLRSEGDKCERCYRLKRQCEPSEPIRRRKAQKSQRAAPKIAQLEGRIDNLVTLLRNVGESSGASAELRGAIEQNASKNSTEIPSSSETTTAPATDTTHARAFSNLAAPMATSLREVSLADESSSPRSASISTPVDSSDANSDGAPAATFRPQTEAEQEMCLELFRTGMLPRCPFIFVPPDISVALLKRERPLFFMAICAVAAPSRRERVERATVLKRLIATQMVVENASSMDLLFALLTHIAWSNDFLYDKTGLSRYMMLAMSVAYELRLNNPEKPSDWSAKRDKPAPAGSSTSGQSEVDERPKGEELERCRAILGCFILSQSVASHFNQIDSLQWTPHLDTCLRSLEISEDKPFDETLVFEARLHHIVQKAASFYRQSDGASPATMLYMSALRDQLWEVKIPQLSNAGIRGFLQAQVWFVELCIWDALGDCQPKTVAPILGNSSLRTQRIECLWKSVNAVKSSVDILLSLSPLAWVGVSLLEISQITKSFRTLLCLATHDDPAWDKQAVRDVCDPLPVLDQVIRLSDEASVVVGETARDDLFRTLGNNTRGLREWARFSLGATVEVSNTKDRVSAEGPAEESWGQMPPFFSSFTIPTYGFFGTGEWMERIFEEPY